MESHVDGCLSEGFVVSRGVLGYRIVSPFLLQNAYVLIDKGDASAVVIDPGVRCFDAIESILRKSCCQPEYIIITHEHYDHIGSVDKLRRAFQCKVVASPSCSSQITDAKKNLSIFYERDGYITAPAEIVLCGTVTKLPWHRYGFTLFSTPGHTGGSICIYFTGHLFTGDTIIKDEKTVTKLPGGSRPLLLSSLGFIFSTFDPNTMLHPGHGDGLMLRDTVPQIHCPPLRREPIA